MIDFENLKDFDGEQINQILDHSALEVPYQSKPHDRTNKRMYTFNYHSNSDEYKNLGNEKHWVDVTRRETIEGAERAIDSSIDHYKKKLRVFEGPKVVKTFK